MVDLADLTLVEAADAVRKGDATSHDLLSACWDRMEEVNPTLNATIWVDRLGAERAARAADASRDTNEWSGPLHGVPLAHKDMYYQAGRLSTCGSRLRKDFRPEITSTAIERLAAAGAYSFAGLNMAEFAQNPTGHNREFGDCHNPWNPPYITGGSSSGSGAAVAARFAYAALGSDTGGSIRLPASACGVTGLKPTQTRVSRYGAMPLSFTLDNVGPLARTARDCARVMMLIAGRDPKDPTSSHLPVPDYEGALDGDVRGMRIGIPENYFFDAADPAVTAAIEHAVEVLRARGATVTRLTLPVMDAVSGYGSIISRVEAGAIHAEWMRHRAQDFAPHLSARLYLGYAIPGPYYVESLSRRGPVLRAFAAEVFAKVDVLATPTIPMALPTLDETDIDNGPAGTEAKVLAISANTRPFNYLGLPAISIPCGFDANGLPIGLQLAGRPFAEARLMRMADAYQRDTDWHRRHPPVLKASGPFGFILA
jgi:aspartyl-tRNA(Asn)/glutamyl-tRNA(Gln) amidotransferase subunit A